ncbi:MAG: RnfABCDGE type electron transport complex subunit G [Paludibacteraceae bacterium]
MERLKSNFLNMALSLTVIALVAAGALAWVYTITKEPISLAKEQKKEQAIKDVLPEYTRTDAPDTINGLSVVRAYNNDTFIGAAVETSGNGFGGTIRLMVGFDADGNICNYSVLEQAETPGLGTKMVDWFKTAKNKQDVRGLNPGKVNFTVNKDGGDIDAITAATISSRAFLLAVRNAYNAYSENPQADGLSGASQQAHAVDTTATDSVAATVAIDTDSVSPNPGTIVVAPAPTRKPQPLPQRDSLHHTSHDTTIVEPEKCDTL